MLKKILSIATCGALALASFCATFFSLKAIRANASEAEVLLYTLDFTDIPREFVDVKNSNSVNSSDVNFEAWEEIKLNELKARGFTMGEEFNLGGHDSKFFYQTIPESWLTVVDDAGSFDSLKIDPCAFFLKFEGGTSFEKTLESETRIKIYVDPVNYYWHGAINEERKDSNGTDITQQYISEINVRKTRDYAVSLRINDVAISDNITGVIEQDLSGYDSVKITQDLKGVTVYKIEFYGLPETNNPLKPDDGASDTVIEDKLLYAYDFTAVDYKYLNSYGGYVSASAAHAGFSELETLWREKIESDGWVLGSKFDIFDHSSTANFYQTIPGCIFYSDVRDPYLFGLKLESQTSFTKARKNETRIKIYVDPVSYYYDSYLSFMDSTEYYDLYTRSNSVWAKINGEHVSDNCTGVIEYNLLNSDKDIISIARAGSSAGQQARNIYKIEVYGIEEPAAPTVEEESWFTEFLSNIGLGALPIGASIAVLIAGVIIIRKILK